jgi:hypothetical protein
LVKVGDSNTWKDGMVICESTSMPQATTPGLYITGADYEAWVEADVEPPGFPLLPASAQQHHQAFMLQVRSGLPRAVVEYDKIKANGYDTNWGRADLKTHAVMMMNVTTEQYGDLTAVVFAPPGPLDPATGMFKDMGAMLARRSKKLQYASKLSPSTLSKIQDKTVTVPPNRKASPGTALLIQDVP